MHSGFPSASVKTLWGRVKSIQGQPPVFAGSLGHWGTLTVKKSSSSGRISSRKAMTAGFPSIRYQVSGQKPGP